VSITVYENGLSRWSDDLRLALQAQQKALSAASGSTLHLGQLDLTPATSGAPPADSLVLYFHEHASTPKQSFPQLAQHLATGGRVLPVIDVPAAATALPPELEHVNAFVQAPYGAAWEVALADELVALLWGARSIRKVFLSYCRADGALVAHQLLTALTERGYDTFLDEASLPHGIAFETELEWWLNDADCVVLIASPSMPKSRYVRQEIDFANQYGVGVLAVAWYPDPANPDVSIVQTMFPHQVHVLAQGAQSDLTGPPGGEQLTDYALHDVVAFIERRRSHCVWRRLCNLVPDVETLLRRPNARFPNASRPQDGLRLGDLRVESQGPGASKLQRYVRTFPHRPNIDALFALGREVDEGMQGCALPGGDKALWTLQSTYLESHAHDPRARALQAFVENDVATLVFRYEIGLL
jgi:hypothetical protein